MKKIVSLLVVSCSAFISYLQADMTTIYNASSFDITVDGKKIAPKATVQVELPRDKDIRITNKFVKDLITRNMPSFSGVDIIRIGGGRDRYGQPKVGRPTLIVIPMKK